MADDKDKDKDNVVPFRKGDTSNEFRMVVTGVDERNFKERLIHASPADFMAPESYWLSDAVLFRAGRARIEMNDVIRFSLSKTPEPLVDTPEAQNYGPYRITKLRFEP